MTYAPAPTPDLSKFKPRNDDPLTQAYRTVADYWRRLAGEVANAIGSETRGLYFDRDGIVVAVKTGEGSFRNGKPESSPPGWLWYVSRNAAAELYNHARWAEYNLAEHLRVSSVLPEGEMPERVAKHIANVKELAEAELRRRGQV